MDKPLALVHIVAGNSRARDEETLEGMALRSKVADLVFTQPKFERQKLKVDEMLIQPMALECE